MADEKYRLQLEGDQIDDALMQMFLRAPEGWTQGTRDGVAVGSGSQYYHNNAKWFAEQAATSAARAEGAVPSGTAGAVFFDRDMSSILTESQKAVFRKNIMAGGSNPNLLDNPWFTVNQRGWTSGIVSNAYCVDRWKAPFANQALKITVNSDNTITIDRLASGTTGFYQYLEIKNFDRTKRYTLSVMDSDGNIYSHTVPFPTGQSGERWFTIGTLSVALGLWAIGGNQNKIAFVLYMSSNANPQTATIKACKLEEGEYSTLANDTPPDYKSELDKCQYYFRRLKPISSSTLLGMGYIGPGGTSAGFPAAFPAMKTTPTVTKNGGMYIRVAGSDSNHAFTDQSANMTSLHTSLSINGITGVTAGDIVWLVGTSGCYLDFSADL